MKRIGLALTLTLLAAGLLLVGCNYRKGGGGLPTCPTDGLVAPLPVSPDHVVVPDLRPSLTWDYPGACLPEGYRVEVSDYGSFDDPDTIAGGTGDSSTTWGPADDLLPGTDYHWRVAAINGTTLGPYSTPMRFWTGPLCDAATLAAPTLGQPTDGSTVDNPFPPLSWSHTEGCVPEYFSVELSSAPGLGGPSLVADFHTPAKAVIPAEALADCTTYYWRVTAHRGAATPPISATWSFSTNFAGACPGSGSGSIGGFVWHDLCAAPWDMQPTPIAVPEGCIDRYNANGIREAGEPGLEGVSVDLGFGACPSAGLADTLTAADGSYSFAELSAGTYCVSVDALRSRPPRSSSLAAGRRRVQARSPPSQASISPMAPP